MRALKRSPLPLLLVAPLAWADAGNEADAPERPPRPTVAIEAGKPPRLQRVGLPAVSADGRVAFVAARGEYDESGKIELRIVRPDGTAQAFLLEKTERARPNGDQPRHAFPAHLRRARTLLAMGGFRALPEAQSCMPPDPRDAPPTPLPAPCHCQPPPTEDAVMPPVAVGGFLVAYDDDHGELRVLDAECRVVVRHEAAIAKNAYCCGSPVPSDPGCTVGWDRMDVQGDGDVVVVTGSAVSGPDGCELDRQYLVAWPAKRSARVSDNWNPWKRARRKH